MTIRHRGFVVYEDLMLMIQKQFTFCSIQYIIGAGKRVVIRNNGVYSNKTQIQKFGSGVY